jgi:hypothetical protein
MISPNGHWLARAETREMELVDEVDCHAAVVGGLEAQTSCFSK